MESYAIGRAGGTTVIAIEGDVTRQPVEAVVNSANEVLQHSESVATAIVRTGGRVIQEESDTWVLDNGPLKPGAAAVTTGGMLQASHVIHVVGPQYGKDEDPAGLLASSTQAALRAAHEHGLKSVALPAIATGQKKYPIAEAAPVIVGAIVDWLQENPDTLTEVRLVGFSRKQARHFVAAVNDRLGA
jgi:putative ATPase